MIHQKRQNPVLRAEIYSSGVVVTTAQDNVVVAEFTGKGAYQNAAVFMAAPELLECLEEVTREVSADAVPEWLQQKVFKAMGLAKMGSNG